MKHNILITGGCGFIGAHVVRHFVEKYADYHIVNLDALTYAASPENLADLAKTHSNYTFVHGDICDTALLKAVFADHDIDAVIHLAAESHVDRSIDGPAIFAQTNVMGTLALLNAAKTHWENSSRGFEDRRFYHISTDEVFGALGAEGRFTENSPYDPHSPYSASKAASDHFVRAFGDTYGMPVVISNCTNNYGPGQHPEKLIPLIIGKIAALRPLPVYGTGENVRDWIWVGDHAAAIDAIFHRGVLGETYLVGGGNEVRNLDLVKTLISLTDSVLGRRIGTSERLVKFVPDRPGHDFRYAANTSKIVAELGWRPTMPLTEGLLRTVKWALGMQ